jgi:DNA processing protein
MESRLHAIALSVVSSPALCSVWDNVAAMGPAALYRRLEAFAWPRVQDYLQDVYSADPRVAAEEIVAAAEKRSIGIVDYWDEGYPAILRETARPPLVLYTRGDCRFRHSVAIVGTRKDDPRSKNMARRIAASVCAGGLTVVSGMAMGIDREAHEAALDSAGATIGVLANGIDIMYPSSNRDLYRRMTESPGSGLVSEYPPGIYTRKWTFVRRNRIISGLSLATVVVKAGARSGALITARYALEQNRDVFACTGYSLDPDYEGCLVLIQKGAFAIAHEDDVVRELAERELFTRRSAAVFTGLRPGGSGDQGELFALDTALEEKIIAAIKGGECDVDSLARRCGLPASAVSEAVMLLELSGKIIKNGTVLAAL